MKKITKKVIKRLILSVFVIVLIITLPMVSLKTDNNMELIYKSFVGKKSDYLGFVEIWNVDTFEGGSVSKESILSKVAKEYQNENKGTYVIIRNISENECKNMIAKGQLPDLFSCSYGVANDIKDYVVPFNEEFNDIYNNLLSTGVYNNRQYAIPWCYGNYYLFSTSERVERFFKEGEKINLSKIALETGYVKNSGKKEEIIYSLGFGSNKYLLPQIAFKTYSNREIALNNYAVNKDSSMENTPYDAYCDFLVGGCNVLLGSGKDLIRLKNRESSGKLDGLIVERVGGFTDLIQFAFLTKKDSKRYNHAQAFVKKLLSFDTQTKINNSGLYAVNKSVINEEINSAMSNIIPKNIESYKCCNVFLSKSEIEHLQMIS